MSVIVLALGLFGSVSGRGTPSRSVRALALVPWTLACVGLLVAGCDFGEPPQGVVLHPIADSLTADRDPAVRVGRDIEEAQAPDLRALAAGLREHVVLLSVGEEDGAPEHTLGHVVDARWLDDGTLAVLDRQAAEVRFFGPEGEFLDVIGGPGDGPGEFGRPSRLVAPRPGVLWVLDEARGILRFRRGEAGWGFEDRISLDGRPRHGCWMEDQFVVHMATASPDAEPGPVLHRLDREGEPLGSFAVPYRYDQWLVVDRLSQGLVGCAVPGTVVLGLTAMNRAEAYRVADGALLWHAVFEGMEVPPLEERVRPDGRTAIGVRPPEGAVFHILSGLVGVKDASLVVVQFLRRATTDVQAGVDRFAVETFVLGAETGGGAYLGDGLPRILWVEGNRALLAHEDPFPRVDLVEWGR